MKIRDNNTNITGNWSERYEAKIGGRCRISKCI